MHVHIISCGCVVVSVGTSCTIWGRHKTLTLEELIPSKYQNNTCIHVRPGAYWGAGGGIPSGIDSYTLYRLVLAAPSTLTKLEQIPIYTPELPHLLILTSLSLYDTPPYP